jgi:RNA polymerase sigma-70 factor, ECF subfamily
MDQSQFHRLFVENQRRVFGYAVTLLPEIAAAEEVFQNACVVMLSKAEQFRPGTDFVRWACQIVKLEVYNYRRRQQANRVRFSDALLESLAQRQLASGGQSDVRRAALHQCLNTLRADDRRLIEARYAGRATSRGLAREFGMLENTVYKALGRIRRALRLCVSKKMAQEAHP